MIVMLQPLGTSVVLQPLGTIRSVATLGIAAGCSLDSWTAECGGCTAGRLKYNDELETYGDERDRLQVELAARYGDDAAGADEAASS